MQQRFSSSLAPKGLPSREEKISETLTIGVFQDMLNDNGFDLLYTQTTYLLKICPPLALCTLRGRLLNTIVINDFLNYYNLEKAFHLIV